MKSESFISKVILALGVCMLLLSLGAFVDQANAGCGGCGGTCPTFVPHPVFGCNSGTCDYSLICGGGCDCFASGLGGCECHN